MLHLGRVQDISLSQVRPYALSFDTLRLMITSQWLALTPPDLVKAHLQISDETLSKFNKTKPIVVGPS